MIQRSKIGRWIRDDQSMESRVFDREGNVFGSVHATASGRWIFMLTDLAWRTHQEGDVATREEAIAMVEQLAREARCP